MIEQRGNVYFLQTKNTTYVLRISGSGLPEHLYYGRKIRTTDHYAALFDTSVFPAGNAVTLDQNSPSECEESGLYEFSAIGKGDIREPFLTVEFPDGVRSCDFRFEKASVLDGKTGPVGLPGALSGKGVRQLTLFLKDRKTAETGSGLTLELIYQVYEDCDVIIRRCILRNNTGGPVTLTRMMSCLMDFRDRNYVWHTFGGAWTSEMEHHRHVISHGKVVNSSVLGYSSNRNNPFTMLTRPETTEEYGECMGFNLIYSGNHYSCCEASTLGTMRFVCGINPEGFRYTVENGGAFETPEAVMTWSGSGMRGMSVNMHAFVRKYIVRGYWKDRPRPVLLNSWEAFYFKITESRLVSLARSAADLEVELFVMDDGWFKGRNDDHAGLGDWTPDLKKLPRGLQGISEKIHALGMMFGIWMEPEMVNENSDLYRTHPDWVIRVPDRDHSKGRDQMILDLTRPEVCDYLVNSIREVLNSGDINYVKWDLNRIFSDVYSSYLGPDRQGELFHRYMLGLYGVLETVTTEFPRVLFEGCASGGCRFDLGILCYMPQIWASDDTDPYMRAQIQNGYSYGYPQSVWTSHVSGSPNHQTLRKTSLEARYASAAFGVLGYELNVSELSAEEQKKIKEQIRFYKKHRKLFQRGQFYRIPVTGQRGEECRQYQWCISDRKGGRSVGMFMQGLTQAACRKDVFRAAGLDPEEIYHFKMLPFEYDIREFGSLINTVLPLHIRQDSLVHRGIARVVRMKSEKEDVTLPGDLLMYAGVNLKDAYAGTGYSPEETRLFRDFDARLYYIEKTSRDDADAEEKE